MDFLLLHGTTQSPDGWQLLVERLAARGHRSVAVDLPVDAPDLTTADYARIATEQAATLDRPITVAHSAAGLLAPAVAESVESRHVVWLGALIPDFAGQRNLRQQIEDDGSEMFTADWHTWSESLIEAPAVSAYFQFHDCDLATLRWAMPTLRFFQPRAVFAEMPPAAPPTAPSTVIVPTEDRTLLPEWMRAAGRERLQTEPIEIPAGHCPHVSRPELIAGLLDDLA